MTNLSDAEFGTNLWNESAIKAYMCKERAAVCKKHVRILHDTYRAPLKHAFGRYIWTANARLLGKNKNEDVPCFVTRSHVVHNVYIECQTCFKYYLYGGATWLQRSLYVNGWGGVFYSVLTCLQRSPIN